MLNQNIRVRFAPSPTGPFHIGGARSALFNWLLARKYGGKMILRIEDTDLERSSQESEENIKAALRWLGMDWDEGVDVGGPYGPYRQTERLPLYAEYTNNLLAAKKAYYCYCTDDELDQERQELSAAGQMPRYMGRCSKLTAEEEKKLQDEGRKAAVRFRVPENQQIVIQDLVRGTVTFESNGIGDFVIVKSDGLPVYNYAVVLDDALMKVTHVIRAEEHLSNTPRQVLIYQALNLPLPEFGHISLILGKDRTKMSKRHGATSVDQYRSLGYMPEAIVNFLALLGWSPSDEQEIFTREELISRFSMDHVAKNPAVFDVDKLNWISSQYIRHADLDVLTDMSLPHLINAGYVSEPVTPENRVWIRKVVDALREYMSYTAQIVDCSRIFFKDDFEFESAEDADVLRQESIPAVMELFREKLSNLEQLDAESIQSMLKQITKELKLGGKLVFMPIRIALTGQPHGPELPVLIGLLGKQRVLARVADSLKKI